MPLPTTSPKLNTGITIDGKIKALADLVATHERRTFASLVEHAIWLYVQKRLPTEEIERVLRLLSKPKGTAPSAASVSSKGKASRSRTVLPEAPIPVRRREKSADNNKVPTKPESKAGKTKPKSKSKAKTSFK